MLKYRFLCLSFVLKILIYSITPTSKYYILLSQGCPLNIIHFSIMSLVLLSDIMFLIDYTYYYINLECFITVRIEKKKYYAIILKKLIGRIILLIISSFLIPYYSVDLFFLIILDKLSLLIVFFLILITCLKYKKTDGIVLCYFIMVLLRYMKTFF